MNLTWPLILSLAAIVLIGTPFTYYWFRWSDRWADAEKKRFKDSGEKKKEPRRVVIKSDENEA